jgi:hypothetical protein
MVPVNNSKITEEPLLVHKSGRKVAWACPRPNQRFRVYVLNLEGREIHKIITPEDLEKEFDALVELVKQIDTLPSPKVRAIKGSKKDCKKATKKPKEPRPIEKIEEQIKNLSKKSNAIHIGVITDEIKSWAESKGYKFTGDDGHTLMVRELQQ